MGLGIRHRLPNGNITRTCYSPSMDGATPSGLLPARFEGWFASKGWRPRGHQLAMIEAARTGRDVLLIAPTGGGKTLAGFLPSLIDLAERPKPNTLPGLH